MNHWNSNTIEPKFERSEASIEPKFERSEASIEPNYIYLIIRQDYLGQGEYEKPKLITITNNLETVPYKEIIFRYIKHQINTFWYDKNNPDPLHDEILNTKILNDELFEKINKYYKRNGQHVIIKIKENTILDFNIEQLNNVAYLMLDKISWYSTINLNILETPEKIIFNNP